MGHHGDVRAPFPLQADEDAHADAVDAGLAHAVEAVQPPFELGLHAPRMIDVVVGAVVRLLEADDAVHAVAGQLFVFLGLERHDFNLQVGEVGLGQVEGAGNVGHAGLGRVLTRDNQQVLERGQAFDGLVFVDNFLLGEDGALHGIGDMESAVHARVGAGIGEVEGHEHGYGPPEAFLGIFLAEPCHLLQVRLGGRRDEGHEVLHVAAVLAEGTTHVGIGLRGDAGGGVVPRYLV